MQYFVEYDITIINSRFAMDSIELIEDQDK